MRTPFREARRTTWSNGYGFAVEAGGQSTGKDLSVLILKGMDMKGRSFATGGKGARQMQFFHASAVARTTDNQALTGMAQLHGKASLTG